MDFFQDIVRKKCANYEAKGGIKLDKKQKQQQGMEKTQNYQQEAAQELIQEKQTQKKAKAKQPKKKQQ